MTRMTDMASIPALILGTSPAWFVSTTVLDFCLGSFRKGPFRSNVQTNRSSQKE
jgi:hypothetical protein